MQIGIYCLPTNSTAFIYNSIVITLFCSGLKEFRISFQGTAQHIPLSGLHVNTVFVKP